MDQAAKLEPFLLLSKNARGMAAADVVQKATSEPGIFAFGELMDVPGINQLQGTELEAAYSLLQLFCYGTWLDYKGLSGKFQLSPEQQSKLKLLTVVSLAGKSKRLSYEDLMSQLDIQHVRQLEDLLISQCFYPGLIKGKLDQKERCLHVQHAVARDVRQEEVPPIIQGLQNWLATSREVLVHLTDNMESVQHASQASKAKQAEMEASIEEECKKLGSQDKNGDLAMADEGGTLAMMEMETRSHAHNQARSKRRR